MGPHTNAPAPTRARSAAEAAAAMDALRQLVRALRLSDTAVQRRAGITGAQLFVLHQLHQRSAA
ncbi:MAG: hypothetical protein ACYC2G_13330, partial [Gemmatimonadaceae bacterium]